MLAVLLLTVLGVIAAVAPAPWYSTDRNDYELVGRELLIPGCSSLHCFRKLVPIVIEQLPGPSLLKWKAYAVVTNAFAALAVGRLSLMFGLPGPAAMLAVWLSALGFGSLFTLFDPHTADPLMFLLGPILTILLLENRTGRATWIAAVGVFAKEFVAAPLWMAAVAASMARRWGPMIRALVAAMSITTLWVVFQVTLLTAFDYTYGDNPSARVFGGGYIVHWVQELGPKAAAIALVTTYGALYLLVPAGWAIASTRLRQWTVASIPALMAFAYVQQPDRALWNFHFMAIPLAALVVARLPAPVAWGFVATYGAANLRLGAQLPFVPGARFFLALSAVIAIAALVTMRRQRAAASTGRDQSPLPQNEALTSRDRQRLGWVAAVTAVVLLLAATVMADAALHHRSELTTGVNKWGYRGPAAATKHPGEIRIAVLGGTTAFGGKVPWDETFPFYLQRNLGQGWRRLHVPDAVSIVNLATPQDGVTSFVHTLRDYAYLDPDIVLFVIDHSTAQASAGESWRRRSPIFRRTGYLPLLTHAWWKMFETPPAGQAIDVSAFCEDVVQAVQEVVAGKGHAIVVTAPYQSDDDRERQHRLAEHLTNRFGSDRHVTYLNLGTYVDVSNPAMSSAAGHLTARGNDEIAERLTDPVLQAMRP